MHICICMCMLHVVPAAYMCTRTRATGLHSGCSRTTPPRVGQRTCLATNTRTPCVSSTDSYLQVRSMYSHCQAPTGYQRRQSERSGKSHPDISLVDWITLFVNNTANAWEQSARRCSFNPVNFQTHILAAPDGEYQVRERERDSDFQVS